MNSLTTINESSVSPTLSQRILFWVIAFFASPFITLLLAFAYEYISPGGGYSFVMALIPSYLISIILIAVIYNFTNKDSMLLTTASIIAGIIVLLGLVGLSIKN